jgi:TetR/AcrR family transcriptional regulator
MQPSSAPRLLSPRGNAKNAPAPAGDRPAVTAPVTPRSDPPPPLGVPDGSALPSTSKRNAAATRQRILEAGEREFAARGFAGARLREIADAAGVQPALIHHYFTDKQGLYRAVLDRALEPTSNQSWSLLGTRRDLEGLVSGFIDVLLRFYAENMNLISILRHEALSGSSVLAEVTRERTLPVVEALAAVVEERQAAGEVRADVPAAELILAGMSMIAYPFVEQGMLAVVLPETVAHDEPALARRKEAVSKLLLAALRPEAKKPAAKSAAAKSAPTKRRSKT